MWRDLRNLLNKGQVEHHSFDRLKEGGVGERKQLTLSLGTISVYPNQHWYCFKGRDGAERVWAMTRAKDAVLRGN